MTTLPAALLRVALFLVPGLLSAPAHAAPRAASSPYADEVVTLKITSQDWESTQPWERTNPTVRLAQAAVVSGGYLLTSAQVVENATFVRATKHGEPAEVPAEVVWVDREANLATVRVSDPAFFADLTPVRFAKRPVTAGPVSIARWRDNQIEVSEGRITRAATVESNTGVLDQAALRMTTSMTGGGWAEPVFAGKELVGMGVSQNNAEMIVTPAAFLGEWLADFVADQQTRAPVGSLGVGVQEIRSVEMAAWLGLDRPRGLLVLRAARGGSACGVLRRGDVLLQVAGHALDGEGNVEDATYGLLYYEYLVSLFHAGEKLPVQVWRDGAAVDLELPLRTYTAASWLVPAGRIDPPPYLVAGGLVFRELGESYSSRTQDIRIISALWRTTQSPEERRVVVLASVLADPYNLGYHNLADLRVSEVNGRPIDEVSDVREALQYPVDGYHVIKLAPNYRFAEIILDAPTFEAATQRIAASYGIPAVYRAEVPPPDLGGACE